MYLGSGVISYHRGLLDLFHVRNCAIWHLQDLLGKGENPTRQDNGASERSKSGKPVTLDLLEHFIVPLQFGPPYLLQGSPVFGGRQGHGGFPTSTDHRVSAAIC